MSTFVEGRRVDDDANLLVRYRGGAKGVLFCSQISLGEENRLTLRVYGTEASLEWHQQEPNTLVVRRADGPTKMFKVFSLIAGEIVKAHTLTTLAAERFNVGRSIVGGGARLEAGVPS